MASHCHSLSLPSESIVQRSQSSQSPTMDACHSLLLFLLALAQTHNAFECANTQCLYTHKHTMLAHAQERNMLSHAQTHNAFTCTNTQCFHTWLPSLMLSFTHMQSSKMDPGLTLDCHATLVAKTPPLDPLKEPNMC